MIRRRCFWPGCSLRVPVARLGCREHWLRLPGVLRHRINVATSIPESASGLPDSRYLEVMHEARAFAINEAGPAA